MEKTPSKLDWERIFTERKENEAPIEVKEDQKEIELISNLSDCDLKEKIKRIRGSLSISARLPDKGEKFRRNFRLHEEEFKRRSELKFTKVFKESVATWSPKSKRTRDDFLSGRIQVPNLEKIEPCFQKRTTSVDGQKETAKDAAYQRSLASKATDPYTIENCMDVLEMVEGISDDSYNNVLEKFKDEDWRKIFIKMSSPRRKMWLDRLGR